MLCHSPHERNTHGHSQRAIAAHRPGRTRRGAHCHIRARLILGPDARFGQIAGVVRTRVGYAGGTTPDPTYRALGDHSESIQIDYDPAVLGYTDLLEVFWSEHRPATPPRSLQYASGIFVSDDEQHVAAEASKRSVESVLGRVFTRIEPLERFYVAEDYHQKYRLRGEPVLARELSAIYSDPAALRDSTAAARINGYLDGHGTLDELEAEIDSYGLSGPAAERLRSLVRARGRRLGAVIGA